MQSTLQRLTGLGSPFELVRAGSAVSELLTFRNAPATLNTIYERARKFSQRPLLSLETGQFSYGDALTQAFVLARTLVQRDGIEAGQRVAIVLPSGMNWLVAFIAVTSIGATAVLVVPTWSSRRLMDALLETECRTCIVDRYGSERLRNQNYQGMEIRLDLEELARTASTVENERCFQDVPLGGHEGALIAFTSGSTSIPKGVLSTHHAVVAGMMNMMLGGALASMRQTRAVRRASGPPSSLLLAPFAHISGYSHLLMMMWSAGHVFAMPVWNCQRALEEVSRNQLRSVIGLNPDSLRDLVQADLQVHDLGSVSALGLYGMSLNETVREQVRSVLPGAELGASYGMTETNGSICVASTEDLGAHPGTCGFITPTVQVRIVSPAGAELPPGEDGEVWIRGAMLMSSYCTRSQGDDSLTDDGWFRTGDRGRIDEGRFLYLSGRCQDFIPTGMNAPSCGEIEAAIKKVVPGDVAVLVADKEANIPRIVVVVASSVDSSPGNTKNLDEVRRLARNFRCEFRVVCVDRLPRTATGKVDRQSLHAAYF